jgi:hypothetical protein
MNVLNLKPNVQGAEMKKLAKRTTKVTRSKTLSVTAKANELKAKGEDIVVLTVENLIFLLRKT